MMHQPALAVIILGMMEQNNMNAGELAELSGYSRSYIDKLIKAKSCPTLDAAHDVFNALGTTLSHIIYQIEIHENRVNHGEAKPVVLPEPTPKKANAAMVFDRGPESVVDYREPSYTTERRRSNMAHNEQYRTRTVATAPSEELDPGTEALNVAELLDTVDLAYMPSQAKGLPLDGQAW